MVSASHRWGDTVSSRLHYHFLQDVILIFFTSLYPRAGSEWLSLLLGNSEYVEEGCHQPLWGVPEAAGALTVLLKGSRHSSTCVFGVRDSHSVSDQNRFPRGKKSCCIPPSCRQIAAAEPSVNLNTQDLPPQSKSGNSALPLISTHLPRLRMSLKFHRMKMSMPNHNALRHPGNVGRIHHCFADATIKRSCLRKTMRSEG